jgi:hypothetical protein
MNLHGHAPVSEVKETERVVFPGLSCDNKCDRKSVTAHILPRIYETGSSSTHTLSSDTKNLQLETYSLLIIGLYPPFIYLRTIEINPISNCAFFPRIYETGSSSTPTLSSVPKNLQLKTWNYLIIGLYLPFILSSNYRNNSS